MFVRVHGIVRVPNDTDATENLYIKERRRTSIIILTISLYCNYNNCFVLY